MINIKDWKTWALAILVLIVIAASTFVFAENTEYKLKNRGSIIIYDDIIEDVEKDKSETSPIVDDIKWGVNLTKETETQEQTEETEQQEAELENNIGITRYDIPLSEELQEYICNLCEEYQVPPEVIIAMISVESHFDPNAFGGSGEIGLMQIIPSTGAWILSQLEIPFSWDPEDDIYINKLLYDEKTNILCGIYLLQHFTHQYDSIDLSLMCYNSGQGMAESLWSEGVYETWYTIRILEEVDVITNLAK